MRKAMIVSVTGIVLILLPYLGIPELFQQYLTVGSGVLMLIFGYLFMRDEMLRRSDLGNGERGSDSYVETTESLFSDHTLQ